MPKDEWQPIETAPKDGSKVDLWITPPAGAVTCGSYNRVSDCWFSDGRWWLYDETKYASDAANCRSEVWYATHWMPLPKPPKEPNNVRFCHHCGCKTWHVDLVCEWSALHEEAENAG